MGSTGGSLDTSENVGYFFLSRAGVTTHCQRTSARRTLPHVNTSSYQVAPVKFSPLCDPIDRTQKSKSANVGPRKAARPKVAWRSGAGKGESPSSSLRVL
eukprot:2365244-Prymnesium_polylepis.1